MYKNLPFLELIAVDLYYSTEGEGSGISWRVACNPELIARNSKKRKKERKREKKKVHRWLRGEKVQREGNCRRMRGEYKRWF